MDGGAWKSHDIGLEPDAVSEREFWKFWEG